ncbi:hypothetical protein EBI_25500 [Enterocytozoon bieneusi H348]|nr:hypothetical protein EBI_25500 [Enterocytozoon bieneusi H348]|eukprot:XP_001828027.1 hypothetical protein EBI_25500 [Enterocytozoon bieneusi H348]
MSNNDEFKAPIIKKLNYHFQNILEVNANKIISLLKQPTVSKVAFKKINTSTDEFLIKYSEIILEEILNIMINKCYENKLIYKTISKLAHFIPKEKLKTIYKGYAICMLQKWPYNYKFIFYIHNKYPMIIKDSISIFELYIKDKSILQRLLK